jgi:hypothetical protein
VTALGAYGRGRPVASMQGSGRDRVRGKGTSIARVASWSAESPPRAVGYLLRYSSRALERFGFWLQGRINSLTATYVTVVGSYGD